MEKSSAYESGYAVGQVIGGLLVLLLFAAVFGFFIFAVVKAFTRKTKGWIVTAVTMGVFGVGGVVVSAAGLVVFAVKDAARRAKTEVVLTSEDGRHSLSVPGNWKSLPELHDNAEIRAGNMFASRFAIVIVESKEDTDMSLTDYADFTASDLKKEVGDTSIPKPQAMTVGGFPAIRHRLSGTTERINIIYYHTCVETPTSLCQIMCWGLKSDEKIARPIFDKVAESFVEKKEE